MPDPEESDEQSRAVTTTTPREVIAPKGDGRIDLGRLAPVVAAYMRQHRAPTVAPRQLLQAPIFHDERAASRLQSWIYKWEHREGGKREQRAVQTINNLAPGRPTPVIDPATGEQMVRNGKPVFRPCRGDSAGLLRWLDLDVSMAISHECVRRGTQRISIEEQLIFDWLGYQNLVRPPVYSLRASFARLRETRIVFYDPSIGTEDPLTVDTLSILTRATGPKDRKRGELDVSLSDEWIVAITEGNDRQVVDLRPYFHLVRRIRQAEGVENDDFQIPAISRSILLFLASIRKDDVSVLPIDWLQSRFEKRQIRKDKGCREYFLCKDSMDKRSRVRKSLDALGRFGILSSLDLCGDKITCTWGDPRILDPIPHLLPNPQTRIFGVELLTGVIMEPVPALSSSESVATPPASPIEAAPPTVADNHGQASPPIGIDDTRILGLIELVTKGYPKDIADTFALKAAQIEIKDGPEVLEACLREAVGERAARVLLKRVMSGTSEPPDPTPPVNQDLTPGPTKAVQEIAPPPMEAPAAGGDPWDYLLEERRVRIPDLTEVSVKKWRTDWITDGKSGDIRLFAMLTQVILDKDLIEKKGFKLVQRAGLFAKNPTFAKWDVMSAEEGFNKKIKALCEKLKCRVPTEVEQRLADYEQKRIAEGERRISERRKTEELEKAARVVEEEMKSRIEEQRSRSWDAFKNAILPCLNHWQVANPNAALDAIRRDKSFFELVSDSGVMAIQRREAGALRKVFLVLDKHGGLVEEKYYPTVDNLPPSLPEI